MAAGRWQRLRAASHFVGETVARRLYPRAVPQQPQDAVDFMLPDPSAFVEAKGVSSLGICQVTAAQWSFLRQNEAASRIVVTVYDKVVAYTLLDAGVRPESAVARSTVAIVDLQVAAANDVFDENGCVLGFPLLRFAVTSPSRSVETVTVLDIRRNAKPLARMLTPTIIIVGERSPYMNLRSYRERRAKVPF